MSEQKTFKGSLSLRRGDLHLDWPNAAPPDGEAGVYTLLAPAPFARLRGESKKLYVGRSRTLGKRLREFERWTHNAATRVDWLLREAPLWDDLPLAEREIIVQAELFDDEELEEVRTLANYESRHCELPPLNRSVPGQVAFLVLSRLADGIRQQLLQLTGIKDASLKLGGAWHDASENITYMDIKWHGSLKLQLAWALPGASAPEWWPDTSLEFQTEMAWLSVDRHWKPWDHAAVPASPQFHVCSGDEEDWLIHAMPLPLPRRVMERLPDKWCSLLKRNALTEDAPEIDADVDLSEALRKAWKHLLKRVEAVEEET